MPSISMQKLYLAKVSRILTLLEKYGLVVLASSANMLTKSSKISCTKIQRTKNLYELCLWLNKKNLKQVRESLMGPVGKKNFFMNFNELVTRNSLSSKGGSGAMTRMISLQQIATRSLTSLSLLWSKPCLTNDPLRGFMAGSNEDFCSNSNKALAACCKKWNSK